MRVHEEVEVLRGHLVEGAAARDARVVDHDVHTPELVERVFDEVAFVKRTQLTFLQVQRIRTALGRDYDENSQDNGYLLNQIVRRYEDRNPEGVGSVFNMPEQIAALTGAQIQQAAQNYLNTDNYVRVTLMPEK